MFFANSFQSVITLGITDKDTEGTWKTFYGEPIPFESWNRKNGNNEPNGGRSSNYAFMYTKPSEATNGPDYPAGSWNDVDGLYMNSICTYIPSVDGQFMFIFKNKVRKVGLVVFSTKSRPSKILTHTKSD